MVRLYSSFTLESYQDFTFENIPHLHRVLRLMSMMCVDDVPRRVISNVEMEMRSDRELSGGPVS
jgi:hypothetical protein